MIFLISEGRNLSAYQQISARYLNTRLRYYYFRFLKTNVRHVGTLLPVRIFRFASLSASHSASVYQISSKLDHPRRISMTSYPFFEMVAVSHIELSQGYCRPLTKCKWGPRSVLKFRLDRIYSFGDIAISVL